MSELARWTALLTRTRAELEAREDSETEPGEGYGALEDVDLVATAEGDFFFRGDALELVNVPRKVVGGQPAEPLIAELGDGERLRAWTEKRSRLHVWPEHGLAASVDPHGAIELLEVFPPTTLDDYRSRIYEEPTPFIK
jgi:hypothetical protein